MTGFLDASRPPGLLPADHSSGHQLFDATMRANRSGWILNISSRAAQPKLGPPFHLPSATAGQGRCGDVGGITRLTGGSPRNSWMSIEASRDGVGVEVRTRRGLLGGRPRTLRKALAAATASEAAPFKVEIR